jgi:hypothetical protein
MVVLLVCRGRRSNGEEAQQHGAQVEHAKPMAPTVGLRCGVEHRKDVMPKVGAKQCGLRTGALSQVTERA